MAQALKALPIDALPRYEAVAGQTSPDDRFSAEDVAFAEDPIGYHLDAYRKHGPIYRTQFRNQEWVAIAGLEANDLCWTNADVWSYQKAMAGFGEELGFVHVTTLDGVPHRRKRRALGAGFRASVVFRHLPAQRIDECLNRVFGRAIGWTAMQLLVPRHRASDENIARTLRLHDWDDRVSAT